MKSHVKTAIFYVGFQHQTPMGSFTPSRTKTNTFLDGALFFLLFDKEDINFGFTNLQTGGHKDESDEEVSIPDRDLDSKDDK
jgi:hypothetical protein